MKYEIFIDFKTKYFFLKLTMYDFKIVRVQSKMYFIGSTY